MKLSLFSPLCSAAPPIWAMKGHPEFAEWAAQLVHLAQHDDLAPLRQVLCGMAQDALVTQEPLGRFLQHEAQHVSLETYLRASEIAMDEAGAQPYAAFALSLVALGGWATLLGDALYEQRLGVPAPGWGRVPYACAEICLQVDALEEAKLLVDESYNVLMASKGPTIQLHEILGRHRQLAWKILRKQDEAVRYLAEDLRDSCGPVEPNLRAEVGAMLWSLGLAPESQMFRRTADPGVLPSSAFFRRLIRQSLDYMPYDPLVQHIWLELKDRPPFDIRKHTVPFSKINTKYQNAMFMLDEGLTAPPSRLYARTLIQWFKGTLTAGAAHEYVEFYDSLHDAIPGPFHPRMNGLAYFLAREHGLLADGSTAEQELEVWYSNIETASHVREQSDLYPERPEINSTMTLPLFHLVETVLNQAERGAGSDIAALERLLRAVEGYRASALAFWLRVVPPLPAPEERAKLEALLRQEQVLEDHLRGAYFLVLYPLLPAHFGRYGAEVGEFWGRKPAQFLNAETGRQEFEAVVTDLQTLWTQMQDLAPRYVKKRREPAATRESLVSAINAHAIMRRG